MVKAANRVTHEVHGHEFDWDLGEGLLRVSGSTSLTIWIESSLAGLMQGMQRMVGTERFNLAMQGGGRDSVEGDWALISQSPTFEEGFAVLSGVAWPCGWGRWEVVSLDRETPRAVFRVTNGWEPLYQRALGLCWGSSMLAGKLSGLCAKLFEVNCWAEQTKFQAKGEPYDEFVVEPSDTTIEQSLEALLGSDHATRADLAVALEKLRYENEVRTAAQNQARELIEQQQRDLDVLSVPLLQIWDGVLALPLLGSLTTTRAQALMERLLEAIQASSTRFALIDVTGVDTIDTATADHLLRVVRATAMLGTQCIVTGIQPAVAQTLVTLETNLEEVRTCATLRDGLKYCMERLS